MPLTTQQLLDEAKAALHALNTGTMARVSVDKDGSRVEFAVANKEGLRNYIAELENTLTKPQCCTGTAQRVRGPLGFYF